MGTGLLILAVLLTASGPLDLTFRHQRDNMLSTQKQIETPADGTASTVSVVFAEF